MSADDLQTRLKALTPEQIRRLMANKRVDSAVPTPTARAHADGSLPVSRAQERFWFLSRLYPDTPDYNIPLAVLIDGPGVDRDTLQRNLDAVIAGHDVFRTTFHARGDGVVQIVHPSLALAVECQDGEAEYAAEGEGFIERVALAHGSLVFSADTLPLVAVKLVRLAATRHLLLLNIHHLISDGWSNSLLSQSLATPAGAAPPAPPARQYHDFVAFEQAWLQGEECREQLAFWQDLLRDAPPPVAFAQRDEGAAVNAGGLVTRELPIELCERIAQFCSAHGRTQFQYYMSCFALLMTRYADVDDLVIGTPAANRNRPPFMHTCGLFINTLPLRFRVDCARSFADALADGARLIEACLARQELPYAELVKHVQVRRALNENPLFNVHFAFQYFPHQKASDDFRLLAFDHGYGKFDLNAFVELSGAGNRLSLNYRRRALARADAERLAADYVHVLEYGLRAPAGALRDHEFLPPSSLARLAGPIVPRPRGNWFALFEAAAKRHPRRIACADVHGSLDYAGLEALVARAAATLAAHGVGRGDRVLLRAPRDRHYVIGLLACLRVGAAYVPIAQDAPRALLDVVEQDAGTRLLLGTPPLGRLPQLTFEGLLAETAPAVAAVATMAEGDAAYVVHTSGSTGSPKGVVVTHEGLVNYTLALLERLDDPELASYAHLSALDADLGNTAIFPALASGAALLLPDAGALLDPALLAAFFARHPADVAKAVPSYLRAMRAHLPDVLPRRVLVCGGESLSAELVAAIRACAPMLRIVNHYGPAETTVGVLMHDVGEDARDPLPLGSPLANTRIHLLDRHGRPVPRGVVGELGIAGAGLAAGYLAQPELTAQRFAGTPLEGGARVYRSGDLARLDADDTVIFLGRGDNRVKISGIMVQPEAMAALLLQHPAVAAAHVWAQDDADGNARLMAAVALVDAVERGALREHLLRHYKPAQCPVLVVLPALPLTANGKVDPQALRSICSAHEACVPSSLPRDTVELTLQGLFQQAIGLSAVPRDASFFDLGGSSLQAIALIARINHAFALDLPIATLFETGSVQSLAEIVRRRGTGAVRTSLVALADEGQDELIVWVHPAGGNAICYLPVARHLATRRASLSFMALGRHADADIPALARDYHHQLESHYATRRVVLAGWSMGALIAHEMAVLAAEEGRTVPLVLLDQPVPDSSAPPLGYEARVEQYLEKVEVFTGRRIGGHRGVDGGIDHEGLLQAFQHLDLVPADTGVAAFRAFLDLLVHHNAIISAFRPRLLHAPSLLLRAREQVRLMRQDAAPAGSADFGWGVHCARLEVGDAAGNHMTMLGSAHAAALAATIEAWLARRA
jgi:amino acid adenylation domain-containing protein